MLRLRLELHYKNRPQPQRIPVDAFPFTIGRSRANDLVVSAPSVSSRHLRLDTEGDAKLLVTDQESTNGTFIDGERVAARQPISVDLPLTVLIGELPITIDHHPGTQPSFQQVLDDQTARQQETTPEDSDDLCELASAAELPDEDQQQRDEPASPDSVGPPPDQETKHPEVSLGVFDGLLLTFSVITLLAGVAFFALFFF